MKKDTTPDEARYARNGSYTVMAIAAALAFAFGLVLAHANIIALVMILVAGAFVGVTSYVPTSDAPKKSTPKGAGCLFPLGAIAFVLVVSAYTHVDLLAAIILCAFGVAIGFCIAIAAEANTTLGE